MENQNWFVLEITVEAAAAEAVEFAFNELEADGTEINHLGKTPTAELTVIGYFSAAPDEEIVREHLTEALRIYNFSPGAVKNLRQRRLGNVDWLYEWKKHWKPTRVGKFIVAPTWYELEPETGEIVVWIDPEMAFGTGTHQTTQLCLKAIETRYSPEMSFFDVGTGTGILAIGAAKIRERTNDSKGRILACDTDAESVNIARRNALMNKTDGIEFYAGSISDQTEKFDFVCANLTIDVIVPLLPLLTARAGRVLLLSGILGEQEEQIVSELKKFSIENPEIARDGEWISVRIDIKE